MLPQQPVLSILVQSYNHKDYIADALRSIINQKTTWPYRVFVHDDCSNDGTVEIIKQFVARYPELIELISTAKNLGDKLAFKHGYSYCRSKYFALLDGDDYWIDETKIQKQITFLEQNPEFIGCTHNVIMKDFHNNTEEILIKHKDSKQIFNFSDIASGNIYFHISSLLFRNIFNGSLPESQLHPLAGDWFFSMLHAEKGNIYYIPEVMSVYCVSSLGVWQKKSELEKSYTNLYAKFVYDKLFNKKYTKVFFPNKWSKMNNVCKLLILKILIKFGCKNLELITQQKNKIKLLYNSLKKFLANY